MAEYITKEQIIGILYAPRKAILTFEDFVKSIGNLTPADVIERTKIDKAVEDIEHYKSMLANPYNKKGMERALEIFKRDIRE